MKHIISGRGGWFRRVATTLLLALCAASGVSADDTVKDNNNNDIRARAKVFNQLGLALNVGTTGLGLELSTPVTSRVRIRAGVDWMPRFNVPMKFNLVTYSQETGGSLNSGNFGKVQELMEGLTGFTVDEQVVMDSKPTMTTFRFMADVFPFAGKGWRVTVGFFAGNRTIGRSINSIYEMPSLLAVGMYNRFYDYVAETEPWDFKFPDFITKLTGDAYLDPEIAQKLKERLEHYGRLGMHIGDFKDGTPYIMEPDKDGTVSARALVNAVRPYVGVGYDGVVSKDGRWTAGFDLGVQFWGGAPSVVTQDGTDLTKLDNVRGKVGDYLKLMHGLPVYPTAAFRLSYTFF